MQRKTASPPRSAVMWGIRLVCGVAMAVLCYSLLAGPYKASNLPDFGGETAPMKLDLPQAWKAPAEAFTRKKQSRSKRSSNSQLRGDVASQRKWSFWQSGEIREMHAKSLLAEAGEQYKTPFSAEYVRDLRAQATTNGLTSEMDIRHFLSCGDDVLRKYQSISQSWHRQVKALCAVPQLTKPRLDLMWEVVKNKMGFTEDRDVMHFLATSLIAGRYDLNNGGQTIVIMVNAPDQASRTIAQEMAGGAYQELLRFANQQERAANAEWAVDIGGNQGYVSALMAGLLRNTSLLTVELVPTNMVYILFNMILNGFAPDLRSDAVPSDHPAMQEAPSPASGPLRPRSLHIVNCAMSDGTMDDVKLKYNPKRIFHSNLWADFTPKEARAANDTQTIVPSCTLPTLLKERGAGFVDVLKIDCEGCEYVAVPSWPEGLLRDVGFALGELHGAAVKILGKAGLGANEGLELRKAVDSALVGAPVASSTFRTFGVDRVELGLSGGRKQKQEAG